MSALDFRHRFFDISKGKILKHHLKFILGAALMTFIAGCAKEPPKCSDDNTLLLIRQIIIEQIGGSEGVTDKELQDNMKIELPHASAFDEKIKKFKCEAKLIAGGTIQMPITYESQLDDKNQHLVSVGGVSQGDLMMLKFAIAEGIQKGKEVDKGGVVQQTPAATVSAAPTVSGIWKGRLEGDGEMEIKPTSIGFNVALNVSVPSKCAGSIEGSAVLSNNVLTLSKKEADQVCTIRIKFDGDNAELDENNCADYHGAECAFSGKLVRQH